METGLIKKIGNVDLYVVQGDITQLPGDAVMTAINSGGLWFGGIDGAIQRSAGNKYHSQAAAQMPLKNLDVVVAKGEKSTHKGQFDDVVFVVDDLQSPLNDIVYKGLEASHKEGYKTLLVPAIRMGVMAGAYEKTPQETVEKIATGIRDFMADYGQDTGLETITFVVYSDPNLIKLLEEGLTALPE